MGTQTEETDQTAADYLEQALEHLVRAQPPGPRRDGARDQAPQEGAAVDRVIPAISVERVSAVSHL
jgi:hypothetical protein